MNLPFAAAIIVHGGHLRSSRNLVLHRAPATCPQFLTNRTQPAQTGQALNE
jgi:hypothetical protein